MKQKLLNSLRLRAFWLVAIMLCAVNGAWADDYSYTFQAKQFSSNSAATLNGVSWTLSGDGDYWGYDGTKGQQLGSGSKPYKSLALTTSGISGTITNIVVNASTAASASATISCTVGGSAFGNQSQSMSTSPTNYTFSGSASGTIVISMSQSTSKALYIKSVSVTYTTGGGDTPTPTLEDNDLALTDAPIALTFDLYNNSTAQTIHYTTSSTGEVSVEAGQYDVSCYVDNENKTITVTPFAVTNGPQTVTVNQAANGTYKAGSVTFTVTVTDSTPIETHNATFSVNGVTSTQEFEKGADIEFPENPADVYGKKFVGWALATIDGTTNEAPEFVTSATMGESDVTYYAVFATVESNITNVTDELTKETTGKPSNYTGWSGKTATSDAVYAGQSSGGDNYIQMRSTSPSGIITTTSGGKVTKVAVTWNESTANGRTINVYGANKAYTASSNLYNDSQWGTLIGTIVYGTSTELTISDDYTYVGIRSASGALYLDKISITWNSGSSSASDYCTTVVAPTVEKPSIELAANPFMFSTTATITCETEGAAIKYSFDGETWNDYSEALNITATTTIYAKAVKGNDESSVASVTATKNLAEPTVAIDASGITNTNAFTSTDAGSLTATVTYNEEAVEGAVVTWSGNNDEVATIDEETGAVTLVAAGSVTFTANYAGNSDYAEKTETYVMNVTNSDPNAPGTENNPYSVEGAIAFIGTLGSASSATEVYVSGIISQIDSYNSKYGSITYWISDDGTTEGQMEVYSGLNIDGEQFSALEDLQLNDIVTVKGYVKMYNSTTPEFDKNNQLVSLARKAEAGLEYETTEYNANLGEGFDTPELTNPNELTVTYSSSNTEVATVDENTGAVELVAEGETTITATFAGNASFKAGEASYTLTVINPSAPVDICELVSITPTTLTIGDMGDFDLTANFVDGVTEDEDYEITWTSSDPTILEVEGTTYEAKKAGEVTITVNVDVLDETTYNNVQRAFNVTVEAPKTYVALVAEYNGNYYAINDVSGATWGATEVDAVNGKVVNNKSDEISWAIDETSSNVTFTNKKTSEMLGFKSSGTDLQANGTTTYVTWSKDTENNTWTNQNGKTSGTVRTLLYNGTGFRNYATSNVNGNGYSNYTHAYTFADGYTRTVTGGNWGTICLPNSVDADDYSGVTFYSIAGKTNSYLMLAEETELMAGVAYIFQADENATKLIAAYNEESIETPFAAEDNNGLEGSFTGTSVAQGMYVLKNNEIRLAGTGVTIGANRAYINMNEVPAYNGGGANVKALAIAGSDVDAIRGINADAQQGEAIYNIAGQKVQKAQKGLYIVNGKKVVF